MCLFSKVFAARLPNTLIILSKHHHCIGLPSAAKNFIKSFVSVKCKTFIEIVILNNFPLCILMHVLCTSCTVCMVVMVLSAKYMVLLLLLWNNTVTYVTQLSCCKFWPDESLHSVKYEQLKISHLATVPKPDWEMTTVQVLKSSKVQALFVLVSQW